MSIEYSRFAQIILAVRRFYKNLKKNPKKFIFGFKTRTSPRQTIHTQLPKQTEKAHRE